MSAAAVQPAARGIGRLKWILAGAALVAALAPQASVAAAVTVGVSPVGIAVNETTNRVYVVNQSSNTVSAIDGDTNSAVSIAVGVQPSYVAVNEATNKVYVSNGGDGTLSVIDGATNVVDTVSLGGYPGALAVNETTNKIYVANFDAGTVSAIDGATNLVETVAVEGGPVALTVNEATNQVYVANSNSNTVTIIDGATNSTAQVAVGVLPQSIAVNETTNRAYVGNADSDDVSIIDGATGAVVSVAVGPEPRAVAVNETTNKVYVANGSSNSASIIDGETNAVKTVTVGGQPYAIAVNETTNKVYVTNNMSGSISAIDGATDLASTVVVGSYPNEIALNLATNRAYVCIDPIDDRPGAVAVLALDAMLNRSTYSLYVRGTTTLKFIQASGPVAWSSSNPAVATVGSTGLVTGIKAGRATISGRCDGKTATCVVTVKNPTLSPTSMSIFVRGRGTLRVTGGSGTIRWSSSNKAVATVGSTGVVTGLKAGTAYVYAVRNGVKMTCRVVVKKRPYALSLSRTVGSGKGYINVTAKTWTGAPLPYRYVKFYRSGTYIGTAKTNSMGKARLVVTKNRSNLIYRVVVAGDSVHATTSAEKAPCFAVRVYVGSSIDTLEDSVYLGVGTYHIYVYGDGDLYADVTADDGSYIWVSGTSGAHYGFVVKTGGTMELYGYSLDDEGEIAVVIWRYL